MEDKGMAESPKKAAPGEPTRLHADPVRHTPERARPVDEPVDRDREAKEARYDELMKELEDLRAQGISGRRAPRRPSWDMSEGERAELEERGITTDPFVGGVRNALDEDGVEPGNEEARKRAERAQKEARDRAREEGRGR